LTRGFEKLTREFSFFPVTVGKQTQTREQLEKLLKVCQREGREPGICDCPPQG
jgi:hypothetical protein